MLRPGLPLALGFLLNIIFAECCMIARWRPKTREFVQRNWYLVGAVQTARAGDTPDTDQLESPSHLDTPGQLGAVPIVLSIWSRLPNLQESVCQSGAAVSQTKSRKLHS